ncbi:DUF2512 family protein [Cohnella lupini]|uniref:Uncharacterized protein DUF2512 n=1 Tax=Cohnella lupini TaxID=1294267 RepID=A0A3D9HTX8_9BACL|nr:uncharacterized protein DUF2512 [Cohnella lupini]
MINFLIKWLISGPVIVISIIITSHVPFVEVAIIATSISFIVYSIVDHLILPATNHLVAIIADSGIGFLILWFVSYSDNWDIDLNQIFITACLFVISEWILNRFIMNRKDKITKNV